MLKVIVKICVQCENAMLWANFCCEQGYFFSYVKSAVVQEATT